MDNSETQQPAKSEQDIRLEKLETIINELKTDKETTPDLSWLSGRGFGRGGVAFAGNHPLEESYEKVENTDVSWLQGQGFKRSDFLVDKDE